MYLKRGKFCLKGGEDKKGLFNYDTIGKVIRKSAK